MDVLDAANLSIGMSSSTIMRDVNLSLMRTALDSMEQNGDALIKIMESSVNPAVGQNIDVRI